MGSFCKNVVRSGVVLSQPIRNGKIIASRMSDKCGSGDNKDGKKDDDKNSEVCPVCQCADCKSCCPSLYDCRKYSHCLPGSTQLPCFEPVPNMPTDVFRNTTGEALGPGGQANKCGCYLNPEYFSFHHMSYYDMHLVLRCVRLPSQQTNRKP